MNESSRRLETARTALLGPVRRTPRLDPHVAETGECQVCHHEISRSDDPWDNGWRCLGGCTWCDTMIGCVPILR